MSLSKKTVNNVDVPAKKTRKTFAGGTVRYIGGIEDDNQGTPLTGSCKILKFQDAQGKLITIAIDMGLYQGGGNLRELNEKIDPELIKVDYLIITHAHLDHIGRLPMLVKSGFKGKIIMTPATRFLAELSLINSASLMQSEANAIEEKNTREGLRYGRVKKYVSNCEKLGNNGLKKNEKIKLEDENQKIIQSIGEEKLHELIQDLDSVGGDITKLLVDKIKPLFTVDDVSYLFHPNEHKISAPVTNNSGSQGDANKKIHSITSVDFDQSVKLEILEGIRGGKDLKNDPQIQEIFLKFLDAGHILGSAQAEFEVRVKTILSSADSLTIGAKEVNNTLRYLFSGDLGREDTSNNAGTLQFPQGNYEFLEMEGTYAGKDHPDKQESIQKLYDTLLNSGKHILLPTFSLQRTQDTLLLLLDYIEQVCEPKRKELIEENKNFKEAIRELKKVKSEIREGEENNNSLNSIENEIDEIKRNISINEAEIDRLDITIISDSPLAHRFNDVYHMFEKNIYSPLTSKSQKERFGKERIKFLSPKESKELLEKYSDDSRSRNTKDEKKDRRTKIILSSGGMFEGGPVIEHGKRMVSNPAATVIFTGFAPPESLGGKLKTDSQVIIEGAIFNVKARIHDIVGFSGHAGKSTLIKYLNSAVARVSTIVHGGNDRYKLAADSGIKRKKGIKVPVPGDVISLPFPRVKNTHIKNTK